MMQSKAISFEGATLDGFPERDSEYTWLNQNNDDAKATAQFGYNINSQAAGVDQIYTHEACPRGNGRTFQIPIPIDRGGLSIELRDHFGIPER